MSIFKRIQHYFLPSTVDDREIDTPSKPKSLTDLIYRTEPIKKIDDGWSGGVRDAYVVYSESYPTLADVPDPGLFENMKLAPDGSSEYDLHRQSFWCHYCVPQGLAGMLDYYESSAVEFYRAWEMAGDNQINAAHGRAGQTILVEIAPDRYYGMVAGLSDGGGGNQSSGPGTNPGRPETRPGGPLQAGRSAQDALDPSGRIVNSVSRTQLDANIAATIAATRPIDVKSVGEEAMVFKYKSTPSGPILTLTRSAGAATTAADLQFDAFMLEHRVVAKKINGRVAVLVPSVMDKLIKFIVSWQEMIDANASRSSWGTFAIKPGDTSTFRNSGAARSVHKAGMAIDIKLSGYPSITDPGERQRVLGASIHYAMKAGFSSFGISDINGLGHVDVSPPDPGVRWWGYIRTNKKRALGMPGSAEFTSAIKTNGVLDKASNPYIKARMPVLFLDYSARWLPATGGSARIPNPNFGKPHQGYLTDATWA